MADPALPDNPESERNPKQTLVNLARRSRSRDIQDDLVPAPRSFGSAGRGYVSQVQRFVADQWRSDVAATRCASLARCIAALRRMAKRTD